MRVSNISDLQIQIRHRFSMTKNSPPHKMNYYPQISKE